MLNVVISGLTHFKFLAQRAGPTGSMGSAGRVTFALRHACWYGLRLAAPLLVGVAMAVHLPAHADGQNYSSATGAARIAYIGRMVSDLDRSVAFYEALGFSRDPRLDDGWHSNVETAQLFGAAEIESREALVRTNSNVSREPFAVRLIEVRGIPRNNLSAHTAWEPGATHFGLIVPDAQKIWDSLGANGWLKARSWDAKLVAPPGQTKGVLAYITDPDGLDIELIETRADWPVGISHAGLIVLDSDKAGRFYGALLGGQLRAKEAPWVSGDFYDAAVGGHGNILRFFNLGFPESAAPSALMNLELVDFQNRKKPVAPYRITDIGIGFLALDVPQFDHQLRKARQMGARLIAKTIVNTSGTREVLIRDPDTGAFVLLRELH